jgi:UDP-N-acetylmuramate dehydrogenase
VHCVHGLLDAGEPFELIGGGSNILASDEGLDATVVRYLSEEPIVSVDGGFVFVSGSTLLDRLAEFADASGLAGLTCCSGIPGTVGGGLAGNAGAFGEQLGDRLESAALLDRRGHVRDALPGELGFAYRRSGILPAGDIVISAVFRLTPGDPEKLLQRRREILALRAARHPDWRRTPTAGSFFKNVEPTSSASARQAAGWFLEQAGAKAMRVGGARPYEKHANIIVAEPGCTARDVLELAGRMAAAVHEKFDIRLEREVRLLGPFGGAST